MEAGVQGDSFRQWLKEPSVRRARLVTALAPVIPFAGSALEILATEDLSSRVTRIKSGIRLATGLSLGVLSYLGAPQIVEAIARRVKS